MGFLANRREQTKQQSHGIATNMLAITDVIPLLASATKKSPDNWAAILRNPNAPWQILHFIEDNTDDASLKAAAAAHPNYAQSEGNI